jgi:gliding motility-associated-like protein
MNRIPVLAAITFICLLFAQCKKDNNDGPANNYADPIKYKKNGIGVFAATAFTPNGDGRNDVFGILTLDSNFTGYKLSVYKDNGAVVFESTDFKKIWDGTDGNGHAYTDYHYTVHLHFTIAGDTFDGYSYLYLLSTGNGCVNAGNGDIAKYFFADQIDIGSGAAPYATNEVFCQ